MYAYGIKNEDKIQIRVGVGVIVVDSQNRVLLERRSDNGMWGTPGGSIEPGESVLITAKREVKEETGLDVKITGFIGVYSDPSDGRIVTYPGDKVKVQLVDIVLAAEIMGGQLQASHESLDVGFFGEKDLPPKIVPPAVKPIRDFFEGKRSRIC